MSDTVIQVENLGKKYIIGHQETGHSRYVALRDVIANGARSLGQKIRHPQKAFQPAHREEFWALKDVSFEVKRGEVVGIIGRNGAGKSTLLKLLSRITEPTTGEIHLRGRVASLLEVGTGFHPELTGRENIFLNGSILGMSRAEINKKFDEIVEFAEITRFLDTPVKRYSSGMYVRLAFAVAAHLEPEILVVDEVLAVGDAAFQKKCLGRMETVSKEGRTVLFVSHNMAAIEALCNTSIVLERGRNAYKGKVDKAVEIYLKEQPSHSQANLKDHKQRDGKGSVRIQKMSFSDTKGIEKSIFSIGDKIKLYIEYLSDQDVKNPRVLIGIYDCMNTGVFRLDTDVTGGLPVSIPRKGMIECNTEALNLVPGEYKLNIAFFKGPEIEDYIKDCIRFTIVDSNFFGHGKTVEYNLAKILVKHSWAVQEIAACYKRN